MTLPKLLKKDKPIKKLINEARDVFNRWIRNRDAEKGCISCTTGKVQNAGHFYHAHIYSALRFNEINVAGQCVYCNLGKAGNAEGFRQGLLRRYPQSKIDLLDSAARNKVKKWSRMELEIIIEKYSANSTADAGGF